MATAAAAGAAESMEAGVNEPLVDGEGKSAERERGRREQRDSPARRQTRATRARAPPRPNSLPTPYPFSRARTYATTCSLTPLQPPFPFKLALLVAGTTTAPRSADVAAAAAYAWLSHFGTFVLCGIVTVFAVKLFGPPVLYLCALVTLVLLALAYKGYRNLQWRTIAHLSARALDADGDGRLGLGDARVWGRRFYEIGVSFGGTALAGYCLGIWMGFRMF